MRKAVGFLVLIPLIAFVVLTGVVLAQQRARIEALENCCECHATMMRSVADSFRANGLDYELKWCDIDGYHILVGSSETASIGGE